MCGADRRHLLQRPLEKEGGGDRGGGLTQGFHLEQCFSAFGHSTLRIFAENADSLLGGLGRAMAVSLPCAGVVKQVILRPRLEQR